MSSDFDALFTYDDDIKVIGALVRGKDYPAALDLLAKYQAIFGGDVDFIFWVATILQKTLRYAEAEREWSRLLAIAPDHEDAIGDHARCLANLDRRSEALDLLTAARSRMPRSIKLLEAYLLISLPVHGPEATMRLLREERVGRGAFHGLGAVIEVVRTKMLSLFDIDQILASDPDDLLALRPAESDQSYSLKAIYDGFEPVGSNCEFGFVQRCRHVEPLALFRWTSVTPENLCALLDCGMEGYERPDIYTLYGDNNREFILRDTLFETRSHTGVNKSDIAAEELLSRLVRRQVFLKRKFLEEAGKGQKIFLYKAEEPISEAVIDAIEASLARLGAKRFLIVMPATDGIRGGTIRQRSQRCLVAYLTSVMPSICFDEWDRIVVGAHDHFVPRTAL